MVNVLAYTVATGMTIPLPIAIVTYMIVQKTTKNNRLAVDLTVHLSTVLFIGGVHTLLYVIFARSFLSWILILILVIASVMVIFHWRVKEEIIFRKFVKGFWKFNFLIFGLLYICLAVFGLIHRILSI
ncbi:DUF3397 domain-containing protein [Bacillaceae bacterium S4-13-58]